MNRRRVIFDTSTLVSAALKAYSTPYHSLFLALDFHELWVSNDTLDELARVLVRKKFDSRIALRSRLEFLAMIESRSKCLSIGLAAGMPLFPRCRDVKDEKFLLLAAAVNADVIISSDQDLLVLHPWNGIATLTPGDFLVQFQDR